VKRNRGTKAFQELEAKYADDLFGTIQCMECANALEGRRCKAFKWIPSDILTGRHDHRKPYPGDNGILFEPKQK
jgi:hypothetical protein